MTLEDLRILVVDDDANMRRLVELILKSVGVGDLRAASSGMDALALLKDWLPDVMLVDYVMEGIDGIAFTRMVREWIDRPGCRSLPIIIMTGYSELWRLDEARKAGANEFLVKPFTAGALLGRIQRVMSGLTLGGGLQERSETL